MIRIGLLSLLLVGCASGRLAPSARVGDADTRIVDHVWYNPQAADWRASKWYRVFADMGTPMRVVISTYREACIMGYEVDDPQPNTSWHCATGWRVESNDPMRP